MSGSAAAREAGALRAAVEAANATVIQLEVSPKLFE